MRFTKRLAFAVVVVCCVAAIAVSIFIARRPVREAEGLTLQQSDQEVGAGAGSSAVSGEAYGGAAGLPKPDSAKPAAATREARAPHPALLYFRANALGPNYGKLAVAEIDNLRRIRYSKQLNCERVHLSSGAGICLVADMGVFTSYYAVKFDGRMQPGWRIKLNGAPSRVRVSPSGRLAAVTVFLPGSSHSYAVGTLSTQTTILDVATGAVLADLEQFAVTRDGQPFKSADFNFWGVTFTKNENRIYATLWTNNQIFLVEANLAARTAKVIREGVECPSLSPDNRRIAFKRRVKGPPFAWRISLLDLRTGAETTLGETRNVDDQVEWLDNQHILYAITAGTAGQSSASTNIWILPITADGVPRVMLSGGESPAVVATAGVEPGAQRAVLAH